MKKKYIGILFAVILISAIIVSSIFLRVTTISVEGNKFYTKEEIIKEFSSDRWNQNLITSYIKNQLVSKKDIPFIREYQITYPNKNEMHIKLYEKSIIAGVKYMNEFIYFDKEGLVLESSNKRMNGVPLFEVKGLKKFTMYQPLSLENPDILTQTLDVATLLNHYGIVGERVAFNSRNEPVLYSGNIKVYLGNAKTYVDGIAALKSVLPTAIKRNLSGEIDLTNYRVGNNIILKKK